MSEGYNSHGGVLKWLLCLLCDSWWCNFHLTFVPQQWTFWPDTMLQWNIQEVGCHPQLTDSSSISSSWSSSLSVHQAALTLLKWQSKERQITVFIQYTNNLPLTPPAQADKIIACPPTLPSLLPWEKKKVFFKPLMTRRQRKLRINLQCRVNQILFNL